MSAHSHLVEVIGAKSLDASDFRQLAREIAAYLMETNQTAGLESLIRDIMAYRARHGVVESTTTSAHALSNDDIDDIKYILRSEYPQANSLFINETKDPSVIGGVRIDMPGEQLDLTVRAKVNTFKRLTTTGKEL